MSNEDLLAVAGEATWTKTLAELRAVSDEALVQYHDALATGPAPAPRRAATPKYWLDEIQRREDRRKTDAMVRLTWAIAALTVVNVVATAIAAFTG